ncbi:hypothetical protein TNCV_3771981 [Trichonephila clavipes]|nr:hypothetical protein TNCV_3771981 [Trichonephila clavipes]
MKIKIEPLDKEKGPAQCFRCQGFSTAQVLHQKPQMCEVWQTASHQRLQEAQRYRSHMLPLPGQPSRKLLGLPEKPLKQAPTTT